MVGETKLRKGSLNNRSTKIVQLLRAKKKRHLRMLKRMETVEITILGKNLVKMMGLLSPLIRKGIWKTTMGKRLRPLISTILDQVLNDFPQTILDLTDISVGVGEAVGEGKREIEVGKAVIEDYHDLGCSPILLDHATREKDLQHMEIHESTGDAKAAHRVFDNTPQPLTLTSMLTHPSSSSINKQFVDLSNNGGIEKKASSGGDLAQSVVKVQGGIKASGDKKINGRQSGLGQGVRV
ncbi:hypothetical protein U1Q18_048124 [Sarracenia purpurea var. burkii]